MRTVCRRKSCEQRSAALPEPPSLCQKKQSSHQIPLPMAGIPRLDFILSPPSCGRVVSLLGRDHFTWGMTVRTRSFDCSDKLVSGKAGMTLILSHSAPEAGKFRLLII
jgi:hypothetical protein